MHTFCSYIFAARIACDSGPTCFNLKGNTLCLKTRPPFYFSNNSVRNLPILMIFGVLILIKFDIDSLYICPPYRYTVATLPWEIQKVIFCSIFSIHKYFRLFMLSQKKTNCYPLTTTPEKYHRTTL